MQDAPHAEDDYFQEHFPGNTIQDSRKDTRYLVNWRVAIVYPDSEERLSFRVRAFDISSNGLSLHSDFSLPTSDRVTVLISIPATNAGQRPKIVEVKSRVVYTVLSGEFNVFRTGVQFVEFKRDGKALLRQTLAARVPAPFAVRPD
ncbi:PilZ domain-containing protein [Silvimonas sp.]|uniref:PilZ domain-containing protein n=1 Tax=Silvimonas sp. TaxID=2650811 RepID=UPI0028484EA4|nr:PilZ domain-containing protein [Silvimonas sp.]MDR3430082.1 PilZ domain-containing protein [Silvimonas sp.]